MSFSHWTINILNIGFSTDLQKEIMRSIINETRGLLKTERIFVDFCW